MTATELQDTVLDTIVGGSSYLTDLSAFVQHGSAGDFFMAGYSSTTTYATGPVTVSHTIVCGADNEGMQSIIDLANEHGGKITLYYAKGKGTEFTVDQLTAML